MKTPLQMLDEFHIAAPCGVPWDTMAGDRFVRHCAQCDQSVYNLSELTAQQAIDLIRAKEGDLCVQLYRRADGTLLTADCPIGLRERTRQGLRRGMAWESSVAAAILTFGLFSAWGTAGNSHRKFPMQTRQSKDSKLIPFAGQLTPSKPQSHRN